MMYEARGLPITPYILHSPEPPKIGQVFFEYWTNRPFKVTKVTKYKRLFSGCRIDGTVWIECVKAK